MPRKRLNKVLDELDKALFELFKFLDQFGNDELNRKPDENAWSVNQIINHLILSEETSLAFVKKKVGHHRGPIKKANAASRLRALLLSTSMKQPFKLTAPENASTGIPEKSNFFLLKEKWWVSRKALREYLNEIDTDFYDADVFKHPVAGVMDLWGMLHFFETHIQRHEKQMKKTLRIVEELPKESTAETKSVKNPTLTFQEAI